MAGIDHTVIVFKNGKRLKEDELGYWNYEKEEYVNFLPFEYGRDGNIHTVNGKRIDDELMWHKNEEDVIYEREGFTRIPGLKNPSLWYVKCRLKWIFHKMRKLCYREEAFNWKNDNIHVYIHHDSLSQSYVSFYYDGTDTYVVIGGYGHWGNVYTHFMHRGYGDTFEEQMCIEAYHWVCTHVLEKMVEIMCLPANQERILNELKDVFGKYDTEYMKEY